MILESSSISGLYWEENETTKSSNKISFKRRHDSYIVDFVTHDSEFRYSQYGIHIGQDDRLTFFGPTDQKIIGEFIDCRKGSPTLHQKERFEYFPSPTRRLVIGRGIAHTFDGLEDIVTIDEPHWFMSINNPDYNMGNDVVNFPRNIPEDKIPVVSINDYPIPKECYFYITNRQHKILKDKVPVYPVRFKLELNGVSKYILATPRHYLEQK
jgi:dTDP-4-dehydrorhamnose 3,5-epimerase